MGNTTWLGAPTRALTLALGFGGAALLGGCASHPQPTEHLAASMAAVRGAQEAGATRVPEAALHLKLAEEQIEQARWMMENGDNARADAMTIRAYNDAELALALARESNANDRLASYEQSTRPDAKPAPDAEGTPVPDMMAPPLPEPNSAGGEATVQ
jgi:hypothetical protein